MNLQPTMPNVVFDASSLVGAALKEGSTPERALLLARTHPTICLSDEGVAEVREVLSRPKFSKYLKMERAVDLLAMLASAARWVLPSEVVTDCRDPKDNKYLELALSA